MGPRRPRDEPSRTESGATQTLRNLKDGLRGYPGALQESWRYCSSVLKRLGIQDEAVDDFLQRAFGMWMTTGVESLAPEDLGGLAGFSSIPWEFVCALFCRKPCREEIFGRCAATLLSELKVPEVAIPADGERELTTYVLFYLLLPQRFPEMLRPPMEGRCALGWISAFGHSEVICAIRESFGALAETDEQGRRLKSQLEDFRKARSSVQLPSDVLDRIEGVLAEFCENSARGPSDRNPQG